MTGGLLFLIYSGCSCAGFSFGFSVGGCPFFRLSGLGGFRFASGFGLLFGGGVSSVAVFHSVLECIGGGVISGLPVIEGSFRCRFLFWHLPFGARLI